MSGFIQKLTQKNNTGPAGIPSKQTETKHLHDTHQPSAESIAITTAKPVVKSPDWEVRYDPTLSVYYYVNSKTSQSQFDHPDEVVSPLASPIDQDDTFLSEVSDHRKSTFGSALKRTLSPKFLQSSSSRMRRQSSISASIKTNKQETKEIHNETNTSETDEDIEEFKKLLELEMKSYETERLQH